MLEFFVKIMTAEFGRFHRYREPLPPASGLTVEKSKCYFFQSEMSTIGTFFAPIMYCPEMLGYLCS